MIKTELDIPMNAKVFCSGDLCGHITHIIYGFYLFVGLAENGVEDLAHLMIEITRFYMDRIKERKPFTLRFQPYRPWEPGHVEELQKAKRAIHAKTLRLEWNKTGNLIDVRWG